jgi:tetratricopeptide (TPR) repeat protein
MNTGDTGAERARRAAQLHQTASAQAKLHRLERAIPLWGEALGLDPENVDVLVGLGNALGAVGEREKATELAERACQLADKKAPPGRAEPWLLLGNLAFDGGDIQTALEAYMLAEQRAADDVTQQAVMAAMARAYLQIEAFEKAEEALKRCGDDVIAELLRGHVFAALYRLDEARAAFTRAGEKDPDHPEPYKQLAVLLAASDRTLARELAQHALLLAPNDGETKALLDALTA